MPVDRRDERLDHRGTLDPVKGCGLAAFTAAALRLPGGSVFPVSAGFVLLDHQVLETPRHVAEFAVDQMDAAGEARRIHLVAKELANETVVLRDNVFQTSAKVPKQREMLRPCVGLLSVWFPF
jgi:hypothetical protein